VKHTSIIVTVGLALAGLLSAAPAQAQSQHTFVSSQGNDANNCFLTTPCRHLQAALAATSPGGEIAILDTAGYNGGVTVTITQAVSIVAPLGIEALIAPPSGGIGIVINAGESDVVSLRGLTIDGGGTGFDGIQFNSGGSLTVENCVIRNLTGAGIAFLATAPSYNATINLLVSNTLVANNDKGIQVYPTGGPNTYSVQAAFNHVEAINNTAYGIVVNGSNLTAAFESTQATATESLAANNGVGFIAISTNTALTSFTLFHVVATNNTTSTTGTGIQSQGGTGSAVFVSQSMVTSNTYGYQVLNGSQIYSSGDNYIVQNGGNTGSLINFFRQ
jgi:hypothetical protein